MISGGCWLVVALAGAIGQVVSARRRRLTKTLAIPPSVTAAALAFAGFSSLGLGLAADPNPSVMVLCMAPLLVVGVVQRRRMRDRDDLPPPLARMFALPLNPLTQLRHPVRHAQAQWAIFGHPLRMRREMRAWHEEREKEEGQT